MEGTVRLNRLQGDDRRPLTLTWNEWKWPLLFMLCMSALGLKFPLAYLFIPVILINRYRNDRYDFIIMFTIFCGEYALTANDTFGLTAYYAAFLLSVAGIIVYKKQLIAKRIVKAWFVYVACILTFAMLSEERLVVQLGPILKYLAIIYFLVPMMAFSGHEFDIRVFFRRFMPYCLLICIWYILDGFVVNGWVFVPNSYIEGGYKSTFFSPIIYSFAYFPRKYPPGLYLLVLAVYPVAKYYKLNVWQWLLVFGAMGACRTFTIISGLIVSYFFLRMDRRSFLKYMFYGVGLFIALYFVDGFLPQSGPNGQSMMRIKSSIDQIFILQRMDDEEELAKLGSGRMAQIIPKMDLLYELDRQWIGFGFLHEELTTNPKYIVENPLYVEGVVQEEVAALVEVAPIQHILYMGYIGLTIVILFYGYLCRTVRYAVFRQYFYGAVFCFVWFGIAGFSGLVSYQSLLLIALSLSAVLMEQRRIDEATDKL